MIKMYRKIGGNVGSALLSIGSGESQGKIMISKILTTVMPNINFTTLKTFVEPVSISISLSVPNIPNLSVEGGLYET